MSKWWEQICVIFIAVEVLTNDSFNNGLYLILGIPIKLSILESAGPNSLTGAECIIVSIKLTIKGILEKLQTFKGNISKCNSYASKQKVIFQTDINLLEIFQSFINKELKHSKYQSM